MDIIGCVYGENTNGSLGTKPGLIDGSGFELNDKFIETWICVIVKDESLLLCIRLAGFAI